MTKNWINFPRAWPPYLQLRSEKHYHTRGARIEHRDPTTYFLLKHRRGKIFKSQAFFIHFLCSSQRNCSAYYIHYTLSYLSMEFPKKQINSTMTDSCLTFGRFFEKFFKLKIVREVLCANYLLSIQLVWKLWDFNKPSYLMVFWNNTGRWLPLSCR